MCFTSSHHLTRIKATQTVYCQSKQPRDNVVNAHFRPCSYDGTIEPYKQNLIGSFITTQVKTQENLNVDFVEILIKEQESYTY